MGFGDGSGINWSNSMHFTLDKHINTSLLDFYRLDALTDANQQY